MCNDTSFQGSDVKINNQCREERKFDADASRKALVHTCMYSKTCTRFGNQHNMLPQETIQKPSE